MSKKWAPGAMRSGGDSGGPYVPLTVGELRAALAGLDEEVEIDFGSSIQGRRLVLYRFKWRGDKVLQIELNEEGV